MTKYRTRGPFFPAAGADIAMGLASCSSEPWAEGSTPAGTTSKETTRAEAVSILVYSYAGREKLMDDIGARTIAE